MAAPLLEVHDLHAGYGRAEERRLFAEAERQLARSVPVLPRR